MKIVSVHLKILRCLHHELYSTTELAFILGIQEFKVRKYLKDLEYILKSSENVELCKVIKNSPNKVQTIRRIQTFLPEERKSYIILRFIYEDLLNLTKLSEELNISRRTLANDLVELKKILNNFELEIESFSFQGIRLKGKEINKRKVFELFILKNLNTISYLPNNLKKIMMGIRALSERKEVCKIVKKTIESIEFPISGLGIGHIELLICIALIRQNFIDDSLISNSREPYDSNYNELYFELKNILFLTDYEKKMVIDYCIRRKYENIIIEDKEIIKKLEQFIEIVNKEFKVTIKSDVNLLMKLYGLYKCYEFKKTLGFKDFYLFNKNLGEKYSEIFKNLKKLLENYFEDIDSYEMIFMCSIFMVEIFQDINKKVQKLKNVIIVYKFLNPINVKDLCYELEINDILNEDNFVYINHYKEYIKENKVTYVITFEDFDIFDEKVQILRLLLPITQLDKLKLKSIIR